MKPVREFPGGVDCGGTTHPKCKQQHSVGWNTRLSKNEKVNNPDIDGSLLPTCRYNATSCLKLLLPRFPCHNFMGGTLKLQAQINPSLPTLLLWYFVKAIWTETDYIVENTSSQLHAVVCAGSTNICDHKTDQTDTMWLHKKSRGSKNYYEEKSMQEQLPVFSMFLLAKHRKTPCNCSVFLSSYQKQEAGIIFFNRSGAELLLNKSPCFLPSMGLLISPFVYHQWAS